MTGKEMTVEQVFDLLTLVAGFDRRTVGQADVDAWHAVAVLEGWTEPLAKRALIEHHRRDASKGWVKPAHITDAIQEARRAVRNHVLRADFDPPSELRDDPRAEIAWRRDTIRELTDRALDAWAHGEELPVLEAAPRPAAIEPPSVFKKFAERFRLQGRTGRAAVDRASADREQRRLGREAARAELDARRPVAAPEEQP